MNVENLDSSRQVLCKNKDYQIEQFKFLLFFSRDLSCIEGNLTIGDEKLAVSLWSANHGTP